MKSFQIPHWLKDTLYVLAGILSSGFALKGFLVPNGFFDGGVTGISLEIHEFYHLNIAYVIVIANIPLIIMGAFQIDKIFAIKTFAAILGLGLCLSFMPYPDNQRQITGLHLWRRIYGDRCWVVYPWRLRVGWY
jgi:uncharacterized membrane-anchored protein YitT (DUF2179 family)